MDIEVTQEGLCEVADQQFISVMRHLRPESSMNGNTTQVFGDSLLSTLTSAELDLACNQLLIGTSDEFKIKMLLKSQVVELPGGYFAQQRVNAFFRNTYCYESPFYKILDPLEGKCEISSWWSLEQVRSFSECLDVRVFDGGITTVSFKNIYHERLFMKHINELQSKENSYVRCAQNILNSYSNVVSRGEDPSRVYARIDHFRREYAGFSPEGKILFALTMHNSGFMELLAGVRKQKRAGISGSGVSETLLVKFINHCKHTYYDFSVVAEVFTLCFLLVLSLTISSIAVVPTPFLLYVIVLKMSMNRKLPKLYGSAHNKGKKWRKKPFVRKETPWTDNDSNERRLESLLHYNRHRTKSKTPNDFGVLTTSMEPRLLDGERKMFAKVREPLWTYINDKGVEVEYGHRSTCALKAITYLYIQFRQPRSSRDYEYYLGHVEKAFLKLTRDYWDEPAPVQAANPLHEPMLAAIAGKRIELCDELITRMCNLLGVSVLVLTEGAYAEQPGGGLVFDHKLKSMTWLKCGDHTSIGGEIIPNHVIGIIKHHPPKDGEGHFNILTDFKFRADFNLKTEILSELPFSNWADVAYSFRNTGGEDNKGRVRDRFDFKMSVVPEADIPKQFYSDLGSKDPFEKSAKPKTDDSALPTRRKFVLTFKFEGKINEIEYFDNDSYQVVLKRIAKLVDKDARNLYLLSTKFGITDLHSDGRFLEKDVDHMRFILLHSNLTKNFSYCTSVCINDKFELPFSSDDESSWVTIRVADTRVEFENKRASYVDLVRTTLENKINGFKLKFDSDFAFKDLKKYNWLFEYRKPQARDAVSDLIGDDDSSLVEPEKEPVVGPSDDGPKRDVVIEDEQVSEGGDDKPDDDQSTEKVDCQDADSSKDAVEDPDNDAFCDIEKRLGKLKEELERRPDGIEESSTDVECDVESSTSSLVSDGSSTSEIEPVIPHLHFEWNIRYPKLNLTLRDDDASTLRRIVGLFAGSIGECLLHSKVARKYLTIKNKGKLFEKLSTEFSLFKMAFTVDEGRNYLFLLRNAVVERLGKDMYDFNPKMLQFTVGSSCDLKRICDEIFLTKLGEVEVAGVMDYARSVNQLHEVANYYSANLLEVKSYNLESDAEFVLFLNRLRTDLDNIRLPYVCKKTKLIKFRNTNWIEMSSLEKIMVLMVFNEATTLQNSRFICDFEMVKQILSPKVIVGCKTNKDVSDRIDGNAASVLAKFKYDETVLENGVNIFENSIHVAKCMGYCYVERNLGLQSRQELGDDVPVVNTRPSKLPITSYGLPRLKGSSTKQVAYNVAGYRTVEDRDMAHPGRVVKNFHLHESAAVKCGDVLPRESDRIIRKATAVTNYNVKGNLAPIPDTNDSNNVKEGLMKRIGAAVPEPQETTKVLLPIYVQEWIDHYELRGAIVDLLIETVQEMLNWDSYEKTLRYSPARLRELRKIRKEVETLDTFDFADNEEGKLLNYLWTKVEMHVKWESYHGEKKFVRGIFARMDHFKVFYGGYSKLIQRIMYKKLDSMVTHLPVRELPVYLLSKFKLFDLIFGGDFSKFESHNYPWVMMNVSVAIILAMFQVEVTRDLSMEFVTMTGIQNIENFYQAVEVHGKLMSGETLTTIVNSLTNQVFIMFVLECEGLIFGIGFFWVNEHRAAYAFVGVRRPDFSWKFEIVVAGDDSMFGLTRIEGVDYSKYIVTNYLERYGISFKLTMKDSVAGSGFLSKLYSEVDMKTICDPLKQLSKGILPMKYAGTRDGIKKSLARARAMSLKFEFDGCPIVASYADCILRCTSGVSIVKALAFSEIDDPYNHQRLVDAVAWYEQLPKKERYGRSCEIGIESRIIVEDNFGISVPAQLAMEEYFDNTDTQAYPVEFEVPLMDLVTPEANSEFYNNYLSVRGTDPKHRQINDVLISHSSERSVHATMWVDTDWFDFCNRLTVVCPCA